MLEPMRSSEIMRQQEAAGFVFYFHYNDVFKFPGMLRKTLFRFAGSYNLYFSSRIRSCGNPDRVL